MGVPVDEASFACKTAKNHDNLNAGIWSFCYMSVEGGIYLLGHLGHNCMQDVEII